MNINISAAQLRRAADIKDQVERLQTEFLGILHGDNPAPAIEVNRGRLPKPSPIGIISGIKPRRHMSAEAKAKIAAAARKRWRKARREGRNSL